MTAPLLCHLNVPCGEYLCEVVVDFRHAGNPLAHLHVDAHVGEHPDDLDHNILTIMIISKKFLSFKRLIQALRFLCSKF